MKTSMHAGVIYYLLVLMTAFSGASAEASSVSFVENVGQFDDSALFRAYGAEQIVWLAQDGIWFTASDQAEEQGPVDQVHFKLVFDESSDDVELVPYGRLNSRFSHFVGDDSSRWATDAPAWSGVRYEQLYPGIDLEVTSYGGRLVHRVVASEAADLDQIRMRVEGAVEVDVKNGQLVLSNGLETSLPMIELAGDEKPLEGLSLWMLLGDEWVEEPFAPPSKTAGRGMSDLPFSTLLGATGNDKIWTTTVGDDGSVYVAGKTEAADFPASPGAYSTVYEGGDIDAFVAKLSADGTSLEWATFLGGDDEDDSRDILIDGGIWVVGSTASSDFPTTPSAYDTTAAGGYYPRDGFIVELSTDGSSLLYGSYLGGGSNDYANAIAVDGSGYLFVGGVTNSSNFPTTPSSFDPTYNPPNPSGESDAFLVQLNPSLSGSAQLMYGSFFGGGADEGVEELLLDATGNVLLAGDTNSTDFPFTAGSYDPSHNGGADIFLLKVNPAGSGSADLVFGTFLGGSEWDNNYGGLWIEPAGTILVGGETWSADYPTTAGAYSQTHTGEKDLVVSRVDATGANLLMSTFVGGSDFDFFKALMTDRAGNIVALGSSKSDDFPTTPEAIDATLGGVRDAVVLTLSADGSDLIYSSHFGGNYSTVAYDFGLTPDGDMVVAGYSQSSDFPITAGAYQTAIGGGDCSPYPRCEDGFVTRMYLPLVFADGFENGDLDQWSTAVE